MPRDSWERAWRSTGASRVCCASNSLKLQETINKVGNECRTLLYFEFYQSTRCPCISRVPSISRWLGVTGYFSIPFVLTRRQQRMYFWRAIVTMTYHFTRQRESGTLDSSRWREKQKKEKEPDGKDVAWLTGPQPTRVKRIFTGFLPSSQLVTALSSESVLPYHSHLSKSYVVSFS